MKDSWKTKIFASKTETIYIYIVLEAQSTCKSGFDGCFGNIK